MGIRLLTAGESHGRGITLILSGLPSGIKVSQDRLREELFKRRRGFGRSPRMMLEKDEFEVLSGLRGGVTTGAPLAVFIPNAEAKKWARVLHPWRAPGQNVALTTPRPGHADFAGAMKFAAIVQGKLVPADIRNVIERASARQTIATHFAGAFCKFLLNELSVETASFVFQVGRARLSQKTLARFLEAREIKDIPFEAIDGSVVRIPDDKVSQKAVEEIERARKAGTTLGGGVVAFAFNVPVGLGSYCDWDQRLDGKIAQAIMAIPGVKAVGIGGAFWKCGLPGSSYHGDILRSGGGITYSKNSDGGLSGGVTNGMPIVVTAMMKPLSTQARPLGSVDLRSGKRAKAIVERHDVTSVPAVSVIAENVLAFVLAREILETFGGDEITIIKERVALQRERLNKLFTD